MSAGPGGCPRCGTALDGMSGLCAPCLLQLALRAPATSDVPGFEQRYAVVNILGHGLHGTTYLAGDAGLPGTHVAVKVLAAVRPDEIWQRLLEDFSMAVGTLIHPAAAPILDAGTDGHGRAFVVTEFIVGRSLLAHCARHQPRPADRVRLFADVAGAVAAAHDAGLPHGHLVDANVLVPANTGHAVVVDFALAGLASDSPPGAVDDIRALASLLDQLMSDVASHAAGPTAEQVRAIGGCATARAMAASARALAGPPV